MVWYSNLFKNFPQFVVILTVQGFSIVNDIEVDVFPEFPYFFYDPTDVGSLRRMLALDFLEYLCYLHIQPGRVRIRAALNMGYVFQWNTCGFQS